MNLTTSARSSSAEELLAKVVDELTERLNRGEEPAIDEYAERYPEIADLLREVLPALKLIRLPGQGEDDGAAFRMGIGTLGDFRIFREIGRGGMGVVYEAEQISLGRRVALKVLPFASTLDAKQLQRFKNEAQAAAGLHHTNIVPVFATGCERGVHFYAMQFIEGQTLAQAIEDLHPREPLAKEKKSQPQGRPQAHDDVTVQTTPILQAGIPTPPVAALSTKKTNQNQAFFHAIARIGVQAAEALDYSHDLGVIHRDIKPANMLIDAHGNVWITDFGLAHCQAQASLTMTGDLVGTLRYMSPEQALAQHRLVDHRTDIYSLGATLYELLTLEPVYSGDDRQELLRQIADTEPRPPRKLNRSIPDELETIVLKSLEKNPADRYGTARELANDLGRYLRDEPLHARRPTLWQRARKWARRHPTPVWSVAVGVVVALAVLSGSIGWHLHQHSTRHAEMERAVTDDLQEADRYQRLERRDDVAKALERADGRIAGGGFDVLKAQIDARRRELEFLAQLDDARMKALNLFGHGWEARLIDSDRAYHSTFANNGLNLTRHSVDDIARKIRQSSIRAELVAALDYWLHVGSLLPGTDTETLREIAQRADDDGWRKRLREKDVANNRGILVRLSEEDGILNQPPANLLLLASRLRNVKANAEAERLLRRAQQRYPDDFRFNFDLGMMLGSDPTTAGAAIGFLRAALVSQPRNAVAYLALANALGTQSLKNEPEAEAAVRKAIELNPDEPASYLFLGNNLKNQGRMAEAETMLRKYNEKTRENASGYFSLAGLLIKRGQVTEALAAYRKGLHLAPDAPLAHFNFGILLDSLGCHDEAIAAYDKAIQLKPNYPEALTNRGIILFVKGRFDESMASLDKALQVNPDFPEAHIAHYHRGNTLGVKRRLDEAMAAYDRAIRLKPNFHEAHYGRGVVLANAGRFDEAIAAYDKAIQLNRGYVQAYIVRNMALSEKKADAKLQLVLSGQAQPADAQERLAFARLCAGYRQLPAAAAGFYQQAFAEEPALADDTRHDDRYNAACAAALAGTGQGKDALDLPETERAKWRQQALEWLRADLKRLSKECQSGTTKERDTAQAKLRHWQRDPDFEQVRAPAAIDRLPEMERQGWRELWAEVARLAPAAAANERAIVSSPGRGERQ